MSIAETPKPPVIVDDLNAALHRLGLAARSKHISDDHRQRISAIVDQLLALRDEIKPWED